VRSFIVSTLTELMRMRGEGHVAGMGDMRTAKPDGKISL
jgi:hypothetical protein